jgi:ABC-type multidrug transport system ATPase subunit
VPTTTSHHTATRARGRHARPTPLQAHEDPILEVRGVTARTPGGRILLDDVSFAVQRGWLVAVVGPTGAGKTSLARALTGSLALQAGSIRIDGDELTASGSHGLDRIAYVPQDDVLHGSLSLGRTLGYAASLRVSPQVGHGERSRRVAAALAELGLQHHTDVAISSLSGGQRKRANIAAELVGQPDVIVLDEPTSGLDPGYEKSVMTSLRQLADAGRTVITVTHSMQALGQCDRVLYLAEGGRMAYFGPPARAQDYFGRGDAADVFLALDTESGQAWKERFQAHPAYARYVRPVVAVATGAADRLPATPRRDLPAWRAQLGTLLRRQVALLRSDRRHLALLTLQGPVLGALLWLVMRPGSLGLLPGTAIPSPASSTVAMFVALAATWLGASNAVREIVKERHILRREVDAGLAPSAYVVSKAVVLGSVAMVQGAVLALIACAGQQPPTSGALLGSGRLELALAGALVGLAATGLGLVLSSVATSPDRALALLPMTLVAELALAGGWATSLTAPGLPILRDLTGAHWGVDLIGATVAGHGGSWLWSALVLLVLTGGALVVTIAMVRHHTRSALGRVSAAQRVDAFQSAARERRGAFVGAAALGALAVVACLTVGGASADGSNQPRGSAVAAAPVVAATAPALEVPVTPVASGAAVTSDAPVTTPTTEVARKAARSAQAPLPPAAVVAEPTPPTTAPAPVTTTTVAPTTSTTVASPPATVPSGRVTTASTDAAAWWTAWYWMSQMQGSGQR